MLDADELVKEYIYDGEKYIPIRINFNNEYKYHYKAVDLFSPHVIFLSMYDNIPQYPKPEYIETWIKVEPIVWLHKKSDDYAITKSILLGGRTYKEMLEFLNNEFLQEIIPSDVSSITAIEENKRNQEINELRETRKELINYSEIISKIIKATQDGGSLPNEEEFKKLKEHTKSIRDILAKYK